MSVIYGDRVRLRAVERDDVKFFYDWVNDPDVADGIALYLPQSQQDEERWFEEHSNRDQHLKPFSIDMREDTRWKLIGNCIVFKIDWVASWGELGIMIGDKTCWGKGYGTEVMNLLLRHCFVTLNLNRVQLRVFSRNARARRTYEKVGFIEEGSLRQAGYKQGKYDDVIVMGILRSEWQSKEE